MAQGNHKLSGGKKSGGSQKRKSIKTVKNTRKGNTVHERNKGLIATTKAINKKNERLIAAKAMSSGTSFNLNDIQTKGKNENQRQTATRDKRENKATKLTDRLQVQLQKLK